MLGNLTAIRELSKIREVSLEISKMLDPPLPASCYSAIPGYVGRAKSTFGINGSGFYRAHTLPVAQPTSPKQNTQRLCLVLSTNLALYKFLFVLYLYCIKTI